MCRATLVLFLFGFSASLLANSVNSAPLDGEQIIGGDDAELGDYPYQISIHKLGDSICGGSIIDSTHIVTAAHCVVNEDTEFVGYPLKVVAGINDLKRRVSTRISSNVEKVYIPKEYGPDTPFTMATGDIAVLKLKEPLDIVWNVNVDKINLPENDNDDFEGVTAIVSGFGVNSVKVKYNRKIKDFEETDLVIYGKMRFAEAEVLGNAECQKHYRERLSPKHLCAIVVQRNSRQPEGVCSGDSGGPLAYGNVLIGAVSNSPLGCREDQIPAIYTRVSSFLDFIDYAVNDIDDDEIRTQELPIYNF